MTFTPPPPTPPVYRPWSGIHLGYLNGAAVGAGVQQAVLVIGPPRSGKTTGVVVPTILAAPGAVVATSTKADLVERTVRLRSQRGRCWYLDPSGTTTPPAGTTPARWTPISGCADWDTALNRAHAITTAATNPAATTLDSGHWIERGEALLAPLFCAAARLGADMGWVVGCVLDRNIDDALSALSTVGDHKAGGPPGRSLPARTLAGIAETDERERSGIFSTAARILAAYRHTATLAAAAAPNFDPATFVAGCDTLYLVSPSQHQAELAPIIVCLLDQIRHHTYQRPTGACPVVWALDEVANIAPLPDLPAIVAEGASQGLVTLACLQDLHQARARWGSAADGFLTLFGAKLALGGISDRDTLGELSYLAGNYNARYRTRSRSGPHGGWSDTIQQRPVIPPDVIRAITPGWALLAHTNHQPHHISLVAPAPTRARRPNPFMVWARRVGRHCQKAIHTLITPPRLQQGPNL